MITTVSHIGPNLGSPFSRFASKIHFHPPSRILVRNLRKAKGQDLVEVLPVVRRGAHGAAEVHLLGHVARLPEGDPQESQPGRPHSRPVPHHGQHEQGLGQSARPGSQTT